MLEESRKVDPSLPSWESLSNEGIFIDKYGFKYNKKNDIDLMHFVCIQLNIFYSGQHVNDLADQTLKMNIKDWKINFTITV